MLQSFLEGVWNPDTDIQIKGSDWLERYSNNLSDYALRDEVDETWFFWRLVVNNILSYTEARALDRAGKLHELLLANKALDRRVAEDKAQFGTK